MWRSMRMVFFAHASSGFHACTLYSVFFHAGEFRGQDGVPGDCQIGLPPFINYFTSCWGRGLKRGGA
ncbi:hypothetical protein XELAEV_18027922mg [Xenopus laevis]|uniref:Secreted protein n=1 Tax=Xenopus laevis TaxID=8355 RepID=A0A974HK75_XENLA|nr:hypothetical protein XELAEV_18027922mg [Xenopus laevis]